jgi:hypothetical protein
LPIELEIETSPNTNANWSIRLLAEHCAAC